jgi:hypothetical protein
MQNTEVLLKRLNSQCKSGPNNIVWTNDDIISFSTRDYCHTDRITLCKSCQQNLIRIENYNIMLGITQIKNSILEQTKRLDLIETQLNQSNIINPVNLHFDNKFNQLSNNLHIIQTNIETKINESYDDLADSIQEIGQNTSEEIRSIEINAASIITESGLKESIESSFADMFTEVGSILATVGLIEEKYL